MGDRELHRRDHPLLGAAAGGRALGGAPAEHLRADRHLRRPDPPLLRGRRDLEVEEPEGGLAAAGEYRAARAPRARPGQGPRMIALVVSLLLQSTPKVAE